MNKSNCIKLKTFLVGTGLSFSLLVTAQDSTFSRSFQEDFAKKIEFPIEKIQEQKGGLVLLAFGIINSKDTAIFLNNVDESFMSEVREALAGFFIKNPNTQYFDSAFVQPVIFTYVGDRKKKIDPPRITMRPEEYRKLWDNFGRRPNIRKSIFIYGYDF